MACRCRVPAGVRAALRAGGGDDRGHRGAGRARLGAVGARGAAPELGGGRRVARAGAVRRARRGGGPGVGRVLRGDRSKPMIEDRLRSLLPRDARRWLTRLSRLRWLRKARIARSYGASLRRDPLTVSRFVLLDPEVDTFTYDLANEHELVNVTARALGVAPKRVAALFDEARSDPLLGAGLAHRVRWRFDFKRRVRFGRRYAWYAIARVLRPGVVVETGIKDGLGSVLLLHALERNAAEGSPGRLISFDLYPDKGSLVPARVRAAWPRSGCGRPGSRWSHRPATRSAPRWPAWRSGCSSTTATPPTPPPTSS